MADNLNVFTKIRALKSKFFKNANLGGRAMIQSEKIYHYYQLLFQLEIDRKVLLFPL